MERTGPNQNRNEPVPVYRYQIMVPFYFEYRFNISHSILDTTRPEQLLKRRRTIIETDRSDI